MAKVKKDALAKKETTTLANWEEELAKHATEQSGKEKMPGGQFLSVKGGVLKIGENPVDGNKIDVVILGSIYANILYEGKFDPENPSSPTCFAFSETEEGLAPHESVVKKQNEKCQGCAKNAFGSADTGRGKACKNTRRLALLHADSLKVKDGIINGEVLYYQPPVTSIKNWSNYVKGLANTAKRPTFGVVTTMSVHPDEDNQFSVRFTTKELITNGALIAPIMQRREAIMKEIGFPYQPNLEPAAKPKAVKGQGGKAKGKRKV